MCQCFDVLGWITETASDGELAEIAAVLQKKAHLTDKHVLIRRQGISNVAVQ